uniref:Coagulation factor V n=1 Tax=Hucho hucho TaxID=62062 RepID=A0A4W5KUV5_9TELE
MLNQHDLPEQTNFSAVVAGMHGFVEVRSCEGFNPPKRKLTIKQKRESQEWTYYIAAEEVVWDYAPNMPEYIDGAFSSIFSLHSQIVFKNMATRPYSIYPHGLTIDKVAEGANYPAGGNQTHGVQPGETYTYVWQVIEENEPLAGDSQCLTRMYHSAVNTPRDIASGLVGPLLICKSQSLNKRNVQLKSDKEQHAMFAVFDENKSWYLDDNIASYSEPAKVKKEDPEFYKSNIMHTINGYVFESGQLLGFCNGEIVTWHVSSVGVQDYIQTATFYGHTFDLNDRTEDILSLFPMTGETITMNMDNIGESAVDGEEDFSNKAIVIGVPRPDFSDYEIYVQSEGSDDPHAVLDMAAVSAAEEYEYVDYIDPYKEKEDMQDLTLDENAKYFLKMEGDNVRTYFITAEEVQWDYGGYGHKLDKEQKTNRSTRFSKVVFRGYLDITFSTPDIRGEMDEHLGILGPVIKAEVGQTIMVFFRNLASRPYSLHANGVSYTKQTEGLSYEDESKYWYKYDNEVQPNTTYTYLWKVNDNVGPTGDESDCRTWAYYSGVNPEKDINSGLIGPLLVCRKGTLSTKAVDMREFMLLFMTFDESKSWYYEKTHEIMERKNKRARVMDPDFRENLKFSAINGIIFSLKGLRMYTNQTVRWHLFNMGSPRDLHSVHFHGQTFIHKQTRDHTQAVYPLLPGGFATLEMLPSKPGLWQLESEVGLSQQRGMQTLFLVLDNKCYHPLGLISGSVKDNQITANDKRGYWEPHLARLNNQGKYNAWMMPTVTIDLQVDFQRPVVISQVATQGAKQMFSSHYMVNYTISYSTDKKKWIYYKGDSSEFRMTFTGNQEAHQVKVNTLFPPLIGRFIRLHPLHSHNSPMVRMEYYGCELDGCSVPLGMESRQIEDHRITASSTASCWYSGSWQASLARLNTQGTVNAWQAKNNNMNQWLQVEMAQVKKITGIITQGAKSLGTEMYVITYTLEYSDDGLHWIKYTGDDDNTFPGNTDNNGHVKNYIYPPIFSRFIRVIPQTWKTSITLRIELLGCDFE